MSSDVVALDVLAEFVDGTNASVVFVDEESSPERADAASDAGAAYVDGASSVAGRVVAWTAARLARDAAAARSELDAVEALVETVSDAAYAIDDESRFITVNEAYANLLGVDRERLVGASVSNVVGRSPVALVEEGLADSDAATDLRSTLRVGDREIPVSIRARSFKLPNGERGRVGVIEDRSDRAHIERELSSVMDRVTDGFFALDADWRFTYLNDTAAELLERERDELLGEAVWAEFEPAMGTAFEAEYERAMETQEAVTFVEYYPPLDAWFDVTAYPSETGLSVYFRDVSEAWEMREDLARERSLNERIVETTPDGLVVYDADGSVVLGNERAAEILGRESGDLLPLDEIDALDIVDEDGERLAASAYPVRRVLETGEAVFDRVIGIRADGERRWLSVNAATLGGASGEDRRVVVAFRDVTERHEERVRLSALNESLRDLLSAESADEVCRVAATAARDSFSLSAPGVALYDDAQPGLDLRAGPPDAYASSLLGGADSAAWEAYTTNEAVTTDEGFAVPLSGHGVFLALGDATADTELASVFAAYATAALDRVDREQSLREQRDALAEQNDVLERAERVNTVVRQVVRQLTNASSRTEIEEGVCMELATVEPYTLAWVGRVDAAGAVSVTASAGVDRDSLDVSVFDGSDVLDAVATGETRMVADLASDPPLSAWREAATRRGFRSCCLAPIASGDSTVGVLAVYADEVDAFSPTEVAVLEELGDVVGYALGALRRKRALASGASVDVTYEISTPADSFLEFVATTPDVAFEGFVQGDDGRLRAFLDLPADTADSAVGEIADGTAVASASRVGRVQDGVARVSVSLTPDTVFDALLDAGIVLTDITPAADDAVRVTLRSPAAVDVASVTARLREHEPDVTLVSRRERDPTPDTTGTTLLPAVANRLTPRQREVAEAAFRAGYFDQPKRVTGRELAAMLDVSQPTVARHVRAAERALFELAFDT